MQASILDCFKDLISIKGGCDDVVPSSGIHTDDVGLSLNNLDEFVTEDYKDSYDLFEKKRDFAIRLITNQINQHLSSRYLSNTLLEGQRIGYYKDNLQLIAGTSAVRKGINVELNNTDSYVDLYVSELSLQVNYSGLVNIKVYDLMTGLLVDTIPVTAVANKVVTVYPAKTYYSNRKKLNLIFVTIANDPNAPFAEIVLSANTTTITQSGDCTSCIGKHSLVNARAITITDAAAKIKSNLVSSSDTGGLSIVYSLNCNHREWMCSIGQSIALALVYKTSSELMSFAEDVSTNERVNTFTFANGDKIPDRILKYESKYSQAIDNVLKSIKLPSDSKCFVCNNTITNRVILP